MISVDGHEFFITKVDNAWIITSPDAPNAVSLPSDLFSTASLAKAIRNQWTKMTQPWLSNEEVEQYIQYMINKLNEECLGSSYLSRVPK